MKAPTPDSDARHRILVADDHPLLREGVVQLINRQDDLLCCGEADSTAATKSAVATTRPDLVLLDLRMGGGDGFELIRSLKTVFPRIPVLILSQYAEPVFVQRALRAGASGYVTKERATEEVLEAIRAVLAGDVYLSSNISSRVLQKLVGGSAAGAKTDVDRLTDRELHIFLLIGARHTAKDIATALNLSLSTVETHRDNIKHKLGLRSAQELGQYAEAWLSRRELPLPQKKRPAGA